MTRIERVKQALRRGEVCSFMDLYSNFLSNGRNDISSLKRSGWAIESFWTAHGKTASHCHYKLIKEPKQVGDSVVGTSPRSW